MLPLYHAFALSSSLALEVGVLGELASPAIALCLKSWACLGFSCLSISVEICMCAPRQIQHDGKQDDRQTDRRGEEAGHLMLHLMTLDLDTC